MVHSLSSEQWINTITSFTRYHQLQRTTPKAFSTSATVCFVAGLSWQLTLAIAVPVV